MEKAHIIRRTIEKLDDGTYKVIFYSEDYITEDGLKNLIKTYQERNEVINKQIFTHETPELKEKTVQKVLTPYIGSFLSLKILYMDIKNGSVNLYVEGNDELNDQYTTLSEDETKEYHKHISELTAEERAKLDEPFSKDEMDLINKTRVHVTYILEQAYNENKKDLLEGQEAIKWWEEALKYNHAKIEKSILVKV